MITIDILTIILTYVLLYFMLKTTDTRRQRLEVVLWMTPITVINVYVLWCVVFIALS